MRDFSVELMRDGMYICELRGWRRDGSWREGRGEQERTPKEGVSSTSESSTAVRRQSAVFSELSLKNFQRPPQTFLYRVDLKLDVKTRLSPSKPLFKSSKKQKTTRVRDSHRTARATQQLTPREAAESWDRLGKEQLFAVSID